MAAKVGHTTPDKTLWLILADDYRPLNEATYSLTVKDMRAKCSRVLWRCRRPKAIEIRTDEPIARADTTGVIYSYIEDQRLNIRSLDVHDLA
jgi:hypothetical protein